VEFHHVPGHTPGSCLIEVGDFLFSGDTIYASGIGKTGFRSENFDQIRDSLIEKKEIYTRNKLICPGHGRCINGTDLFRENKKLVEFLSNG
jgi:glyoxylase-like metal-dependent hydrolase (beta-lactamase superfamily II)